ncbi:MULTISPECIES: site-specific DNA-methyltransferase [Pseudomonas]|uniref:DNA-methyltransferase n=1 Tax=Pseudomonas TaxID=286 RepID=UPI002364501F|nr:MULTISPECIES: site-specific DNA-methyltransferase [Pseudomonas]MDD2027052.1 site-specific DNA-methyltransferase [Pseudomonas putida]MDN5518955.1 site-specific DNA-methyltransferase [Pseudomonas sp.]MDN5530972.1 site-specific DNA-methyltransferase [Pseudomonas sp.]HDS1765686.1 site-specific DNA-methyltransferase [Pseudomonas putida]
MTQQHRILVGDCIEMMRTLPDQSVHTCVTSPPYFGLRDYGVDGQIGLEASPREFIESLVAVFREVRRVLRNDGTLWVNLGDSYASGGRGGGGRYMAERGDGAWQGKGDATGWRSAPAGWKHKDLLGLPWRLAIALQDDGWYLRQDIIWHKPNPMPESIKDRCTKAHEYLFLLSKSPRYHFDQDAIREPARAQAAPESASRRNSFARETKYTDAEHGQTAQHRADRDDVDYDETRNKRSVWTVATASFKGAHFATFPPDLIRPCVLAGSPRGGMVLDPFGGAGTTALVAMQEGRQSVICELNPEYAALARQRLDTAWIEGAAQMDFLLDQSPAA